MKLKVPHKKLFLKNRNHIFAFLFLILFLIYILTKSTVFIIESKNKKIENAIDNMSGVIESINVLNERKQLIQYKLETVNKIDTYCVDWPLIIKTVKKYAFSDMKFDNITFNKDFITILCETNDIDSAINYCADLEKSGLFKEAKITDIILQEKDYKVEFSLCLVLKSKVE